MTGDRGIVRDAGRVRARGRACYARAHAHKCPGTAGTVRGAADLKGVDVLDSMLTSIRDRIDQLERHIERATGKLDIQRAWRAELGERADAVTRQIAAADARIEQREFELRQAREILANQHERLREMGYGSSGTLPQ